MGAPVAIVAPGRRSGPRARIHHVADHPARRTAKRAKTTAARSTPFPQIYADGVPDCLLAR